MNNQHITEQGCTLNFDTPPSIEAKREAAKQYLDQRGINRARPECRHAFDSTRHVAPPRFDVSPSGNHVKAPYDD